MVTKPNPRKVVKQMGGAREVHLGLRDFANRVKVLEDKRPELTAQYPNKWIAMYNGNIVVVADSLEDVLKDMDEQAIPRKDAVIEFLDTERRNMVL